MPSKLRNDPEQPLRVFVAGATGYTGQAVVTESLQRGLQVYAHIRPDSARVDRHRSRFAEQGATVEVCSWDLDTLTAALRKIQPDVLFCLIGTTRSRMLQIKKGGGDPQEGSYQAIDFGLTKRLVDAAKLAGIHPRFVYLSSLGVGPKAKGAYLRARTQAEQAVQHSGLPYVIVRPSFISGPDREEARPLERIGANLADSLLGVAQAMGMKSLSSRYRSIDAYKLAAALVDYAQDPQNENRIILSDQLAR